MRVGVLTGGGDCPGLNAVIRAVVRKGVKEYGYEFIGFKDGWKGPLEGLTIPLDISTTRGILPRGGTILGSSRTNPFKIDGGIEKIKSNLAAHGVDALIAIGGEDTLGVATKLHSLGVNVVGGVSKKLKPGALQLVDDFIDFTHGRADTFFDGVQPGGVQHIDMSHLYDAEVKAAMAGAAKAAGITEEISPHSLRHSFATYYVHKTDRLEI